MDNRHHLPSLQALQALVEVAERGSFTAAAGRLCLTQSAVSRQIQQLEGHYGVPLLVRNSRNLRLTLEGEWVLDSARSVLAQLQRLEDRLSPHQRPFRIRMHVSLAVRWLLPKLSDFYRSHPDISLAIETVATEVVEPASDSDAYILYLPKPTHDGDCLVLFEEALVPVCAPGLGPLASAQDLARFALLHRSADRQDWATWLAAHGGRSLADYRHIPFNLDELALDAAARGLGVAMTDRTLAAESVERGVLVVPFGQALATGGCYALCLQPSAAAHPALGVVRQWFGSQAHNS
ncbi:LysR family transcriptional regulator [Pseudomonas sp. WS 5059]|jgi:LysR family glycine cleavage system transcriptional activator|uniref:LysR substrate-binding domain-containing protein n=1 Tax=unclassified Pseudomonas TaxID=196821 RepID=UPI00147445A6|nr:MULTISPECIES: LysR substrate-binding domain-containing protein [unclassified Pseudomonas]NMX60860.1 LysR family transcriptional regulator [Pseudomonas sp. WS 5079]NMX71086.1 LysR family transcriptional regulator [Pseudomonas sp. WS 5111]NMX89087.1 LysR family transcriptional regulator [Pseudomonas sp. WS 5010]NMY01353.1 LysR family transcriptional regulator [Pseudomonas sp. WS 5059]NMY29775.1 LysR family transcriptional regulator [Pseudomonas sp. WS 5021]